MIWIPTDSPLPRLSFVAAYHRGYGERLARSIAELAREVAGEDEGFGPPGPD